MPCDTRLRAKQSPQQRKAEVKAAVEALDRALLRRQIKAVVGPQGAITFAGWAEEQRNGVSDACAYRAIMVSGSALARAEIAKAEQMAGRGVDRRVLAAGTHSHDGGVTWNGRD